MSPILSMMISYLVDDELFATPDDAPRRRRDDQTEISDILLL